MMQKSNKYKKQTNERKQGNERRKNENCIDKRKQKRSKDKVTDIHEKKSIGESKC